MKRAFCLFLLFLIFTALTASPSYEGIARSTTAFPLNIQSMDLFDGHLYIADKNRNQVLSLDLLEDQPFAEVFDFPSKTRPTDLFVGDSNIYLLDAKSRNILVFNRSNERMTTINFNGVQEINISKAHRIIANYQDFIYLLTDKEIICLSAEGMLMHKRAVPKGISMTIGNDELIRVVYADGKAMRVDILDQYLNITDAFHASRSGTQAPDFLDFSINHWGEFHVINKKPISICKYDHEGSLVAGSGFGSYHSKIMQGYFTRPQRIKCMEHEGNSMIAIYDVKHRTIQLFLDNEPGAKQILVRPPYTVRPSLRLGVQHYFSDAIYTNDAIYAISNVHVEKGFKVGGQRLYCINNDGTTRFTILSKQRNLRALKDLSALAVHENKLYVLDSKSCHVFVFDATTGDHLKYFGGKGKTGGLFRNPNSIYVDDLGNVYVSDFGAANISIFSPSESFIETISMIALGQKPLLLRGLGKELYCLCSDRSIIKITPSNSEKQIYMRLNKPANSFAVIDEDRIAVVNDKDQKLDIYEDGRLGDTFFAKDKKSQFPHFAAIDFLSYDSHNRRLVITDSKADKVRYLHFYAAMGEANDMKMMLTEDMKVRIFWNAGVGIRNWRLYMDDDEEGMLLDVPEYIVDELPKSLTKYSVAPIAEDGRLGKKDEPLTDYFSYAQYLLESGDFHQAADRFKASKRNIIDVRVNDRMVTCYIRQADRHKAIREYGNMRTELNKALSISGMTRDLALRFTESYKLMNSYNEGIRFLDDLSDLNYMQYADLLKEYIVLSFLTQNYEIVSQKAAYYLDTFPHDREVKHYLADSLERLERYVDALGEYEELVTEHATFEDELKVAEINIILSQFDAAQVKLQSMEARYPKDKRGEIYAMMGDGYHKNSQFGMAAEKYLDATRIDDGYASYFYRLGKSYNANMNLSEAQRAFKKACDLAPDNIDYALEFAKLLHRENVLYDAVEVLTNSQPHVSRGALARDFHFFFSQLYLDMNEVENAYEQIQKAIQFADQDDDEVISLGRAIRERLNVLQRQKDPLEIISVDFQPIFPSLSEYYKTNPIGQITLRNNRSDPISHATVEVFARQVGKKIENFEVTNILTTTDKKVDIRMEFNEALFSGEKDVQVEIKLIYEYHGIDETKPIPPQILHVHDSKRMNWQLRQSYASFVNPKDGMLEHFIKQNVIQAYRDEPESTIGSNINRALQIYNFYRANGITYAEDASIYNLDDSLLDDVQFPHQMLISKAGDCEDLLILLASSLENIGVRTAFVDFTDHVVLAIHSGLEDAQITSSGLDPGSFIKRNNENWFALEATYLGKADFVRAWQKGMEQYKESVERENIPDIIEFTEAHKIFPPANFQRAINSNNYQNTADAITFYREDLENLKNMSLHNREIGFIERLELFPTNVNYRLQYAQFLFQDKDEPEAALSELNIVLEARPNNFRALLTSAHINNSMKNIGSARELYIKAIPHAGKDVDQVYRYLCLLEYRNNNKSQALHYFNKMKNKQIIRGDDPSIYADLSMMEE